MLYLEFIGLLIATLLIAFKINFFVYKILYNSTKKTWFFIFMWYNYQVNVFNTIVKKISI